MSLLQNPVIQGLLGGGPNAIRAQADQQRMALAPRAGGGMAGAPGPIVMQDRSMDSLGQGLAGLGQGLAAIGQMREKAAQREAFEAAIAALPPEQQAAARMNPEAFAKAQAESMFRKPDSMRPVALGQGQVLVDPVTGKEIAAAPRLPGKPMNIVNPRTNEYRTIAEGEALPQGFVLAGQYAPKDQKPTEGAFGDSFRGRALQVYTEVGQIPEAERTPKQQAEFLAAQWELSQPRVVPGQDGSLYAVSPSALPAMAPRSAPAAPTPPPAIPGVPAASAAGAPASAPTPTPPAPTPQPAPQPAPGVTTSPTGQTVTTLKAPDKRDDRVTPTETTKALELRDSITAGEQVISNIEQAIELNQKAYSGMTAEMERSGKRALGLDPEGVAATTRFENLILSNVLTSLKATFGAAPTEGERKILEQLQGALTLSRGEREAVLKTARAAAARRLKAARDNLSALGEGSLTAVPQSQNRTDFGSMTMDEMLEVDPRTLSPEDTLKYMDRLKDLGVKWGQ